MLRAMRFTKMHGCGNDYIYLDGFAAPPPEADLLPALARRLADRHTGIGGDGLILIGPDADHDAHMRMFNADGSESEMCGNGLRCAAALAFNHGHLRGPAVTIATGAGPLPVRCLIDADGSCRAASVTMGEPVFEPANIPVDAEAGRPPRLALPTGAPSDTGWAVGMGNPHLVLFVADPDTLDLAQVGPPLEHWDRYPNRCNVEFVAQLPAEDGRPVLRQRTWERGSGETLACGTGACASAVAAIATGCLPPGPVIVRLDGGDLAIAWDGQGAVQMTGEAITVFEGHWPA